MWVIGNTIWLRCSNHSEMEYEPIPKSELIEFIEKGYSNDRVAIAVGTINTRQLNNHLNILRHELRITV